MIYLGIDYVTLSRQLAPNAPALYDANGNLNWENNTWTNPLSNNVRKCLTFYNRFNCQYRNVI